MKVLYLLPQPKIPTRIGAYTFLDEEVQALAAAGVDAYVLSTAAAGDGECGRVHMRSVAARSSTTARIKAAGLLARSLASVTTSHRGHPRLWFRAARMEQLASAIIATEGIDLIHSHFAWPQGFGGTLVRAVSGRPLIASLRGTDLVTHSEFRYGRRLNPSFDSAVRTLLRTADRTLYFSHYMREKGLGLGARPQSATVIRKGVDLTRFAVVSDKAAARRELGLPPRSVVLTVAGLVPLKGIPHILEALSRLRDRFDFSFVVVGDGPQRDELLQRSADLGLADRVVFTGQVSREVVAKYFGACDLFVLASLLEAAGNVVFEAMASGRPVVSTACGGPAEYVVEGETGFVVGVGDVEQLAARIGLLLSDRSLSDRFGAEGRRRAVSELSYDRMIADILTVYHEVLEAHSTRAAVC